MRDEVRQRVMAAAEWLIGNGGTVRGCAGRFGVSKTTIHKDMRLRLPALNPALARRVDALLGENLRQRHIRGGAATRRKYRKEQV